MMYATIYDSGMEPLTDGIEVAEDAGFDGIEAQALKLAAGGTKCCIRWSRDSDGQVAYWGPTGAVLKPHWYSPPAKTRQALDWLRANPGRTPYAAAQAVGCAQSTISRALKAEMRRQEAKPPAEHVCPCCGRHVG